MVRVRVIALLVSLIAEILRRPSPAAGAAQCLGRRRSLHQPFFPIEWSPPPPASDGSVLPPPPAAAAAAAADSTGRQAPSAANTVAIALTAGLVALAVASYSCFLLWRRRKKDEAGSGATARSAKLGAAAAVGSASSDAGSSFRRHRSPPPSSVASDSIYIEPLATAVDPPSPPVLELHRPSPELRPLPPLARPPPPPPPPEAAADASTPPLTTTAASSDEEDDVTYYTAPKTVKSSFSRSPSQRSTIEAVPTPQPPPAHQRPPRPPPPPPLPRRRLLRPLPAESHPPPLANLPLTYSPNSSIEVPSGGNSEGLKPPSLKPLHWDKLRAISGHSTVWDRLKQSDSFRVDEAAMETLFLNTGNATSSDRAANGRAAPQQENRVLDPKRLQNIAILLKALNVTADEVTATLMDGNHEELGPEFYETLAKMAPTKEEELKLRDYSGDLTKLDPAERFLKAVIHVPFAFKRVDAMLYRANFDADVNYLMKSFETLEAACEEIRSSKLFLKLLNAVLKTGNRMNDGTIRGEAKAFKLDTLLKLADVKSTDGKTTLLHFVVQEIVRSEGSGSDRAADNPAGSASKEQFKKDGLQVLAGLSTELANVKKAATMEMDALSSNASKLEADLEKVKLVLQLKETCADQGSGDKFFEAMKAFVGKAETEIEKANAAEQRALARVKATTEYFHGDATKEEPHPLRIFVVVRDFLSVLDRVCKDVGRTPERVMMGSGKSFRVPASAALPAHRRERQRELSSSDEDSSSS